MRQSGNDLLSELSKTEKMSREDFLAWSKKNDIITYMLELFRIVPTSEIEMRTVVSILKEHQGMTAGETWHILSARWWETWCLYTQYRAFDEAEEKEVVEGDIAGSRLRARLASLRALKGPREQQCDILYPSYSVATSTPSSSRRYP